MREIFREQGFDVSTELRFFLGITGILVLRKEVSSTAPGV
jgi:hypothetical protein